MSSAMPPPTTCSILTRGERDADAIARRSARVAEFTGLDPALVRRYHGLHRATDVFLHELDRAHGRVGSIYDATISSGDPFPLQTLSKYARSDAGRAEGAGEQCDGGDLPRRS